MIILTTFLLLIFLRTNDNVNTSQTKTKTYGVQKTLKYKKTSYIFNDEGTRKNIVKEKFDAFDVNFSVNAKKIFVSNKTSLIDVNKIITDVVQNNVNKTYAYNNVLASQTMDDNLFHAVADGLTHSDFSKYLPNVLQAKLTSNFVPFENTFINLSLKKIKILSAGDDFLHIHADILSSKSSTTPFLFNNMDELQIYVLPGSKLTTQNYIAMTDIYDIPILILEQIYYQAQKRGLNYFYGLEEMQNNLIPVYTYEVKDLLNVDTNQMGIVKFNLDVENKFVEELSIAVGIWNKIFIDIYYQTANCNFLNEKLNIKKRYSLEQLFYGVEMPINIDNVNNVFELKNIVMNEYSDSNFYIQGAELY